MNNISRFLVAFLLMSFFVNLRAQQPLVREERPLSMPWCGGLNACQFGRMDLDNDGKKDLVVFDRYGNRIRCFLNRGGRGEVDYEWDRQCSACFPQIDDWCIFADYDGDGREDIFTYSKGWAGIKVYRNISTDTVAFQLVKSPYLTSYQGAGAVNLLATDADYPAIVDLDGDGDLDILSFWALGTFIEKHVNMSVERYGTRDSLVFVRTDQCWGRVAEDEENNRMYLDTCLFGKGIRIDRNDFRHRGATFAVRDLTGDGLVDLLLADVDYPGLVFLKNGGDASCAVMTSQTSDFPAAYPVQLFSMPVPFFTDIDNDGVDDLLVSPFDPNPLSSEGINSVWLYLNHGTNQNPDFCLYTKSFLQKEMVDVGTGAFPVFADVDHDGLTDLLIGNLGNIDSTAYHHGSLTTYRSACLQLYRNVGTQQQPVFQLADDDFVQLHSRKVMGLTPTFGDLNADGKDEMMVGTASGALYRFDSDYNLLDDDYLDYDYPWSAPCLFDVDGDGVVDLVVGNQTGRLSYYHGSFDGNHVTFAKQTDFWGGVDVRDYNVSYHGYSVPFLFRSDGEVLLLVGSERGEMFLFDSISHNINGVFRDHTERLQAFVEDFYNAFGMRSAAVMSDLNADGKMELVVGNFCGGLELFNASVSVNHSVMEVGHDEVSIVPNPVSAMLSFRSKESKLMEIQFFDTMGNRVARQTPCSLQCRFSVAGLADGLYIVMIRTADAQTYFKRVVVSR